MSKILNFPTPHCHIKSLDSASTPEAFAEREKELNTGYLTVTDHGSLAAAREVYEIARKNGLTPILGLEGYLRDDNDPILKKAGIEDIKQYNKYYHCTLHAQDQQAFETIAECLSEAYLRAEHHGKEWKPLFTWEHLERIGATNAVMMSSCLAGIVQRHLVSDRPDIAIQYYEKARSIFKPGNFYVEIFPHKCDKYWVKGAVITTVEKGVLTYWEGKQFKTTHTDAVTATELAKAVAKHGPSQVKIIAIKNKKVWVECDPLSVIKAEVVQDFLPNECTDSCPDGDVQLSGNKFVIELAKKYGDPIVVSDDSHYAYEQEKTVQDIRLLSGGDKWRFYGTYARKTSQEAYDFFKSTLGTSEEEFAKWVENGYEWASKFKNFKFDDKKSLPKSFYPKDTINHLFTLINKHGRMDWSNKAMSDRLKVEIDLLHKNGTIDLLPYFFLAEEVCDLYQKNNQLTGPGRGSSAGVLINYLLGITHVDPLKYGFYLERFITKDRIKTGKLPDIDQDLPSRDLLVGSDGKSGWLKERFGDCYAQISTDLLLRVKSAIKDVCRAKRGEVLKEIEEICKKIPDTPQGMEDKSFIFGDEDTDGNHINGLLEREEGDALRYYINKYPDDWTYVLKLIGITRGKSRHASAYVVADKPISSFIPTMEMDGIKVTQYTYKDVEAAGGVKMDYLVVNSLKDIQACIKLIQERSGIKIPEFMTLNKKKVPAIRIVPFKGEFYDIWDLPEKPEVFESIVSGKTETVFQLNTNGARKWLKEFNYPKSSNSNQKLISSIRDISDFTALDRPGPLDVKIASPDGHKHNILVEYARRARGEEKAILPPVFDEMLPETYGLMYYQESLQKVYQSLTDCTLAEAEEFRSNVAKKAHEKVMSKFPFFLERASKKIGEASAREVWELFQSWASYGFCFAHAASYATIAYACAFLKYYYPLEWWCAVLKHADKNEIGEIFWPYCGHLIDFPDINKSGDTFEIQGTRIRAPIEYLNGIGVSAHNELCKNKPYKDIQQFCDSITDTKVSKGRTDENGKFKKGTSALNKGAIMKLILSGAMDSLFPPEYDIYAKIDAYLKANQISEQKKKPDSIDPKYLDLNYFQLYQLKKKVIPIYNESFIPKLKDLGIKDIVNSPITSKDGSVRDVFSYMINTRHGAQDYLFVNSTNFKILEIDDMVPLPCQVGLIGYVLDSRTFMWQGLTNWELTLEVNGDILKFVKWADRRTGKPAINWLNEDKRIEVKNLDKLTGAIVIVLLNKWNYGKSFNISSVRIIQDPLED